MSLIEAAQAAKSADYSFSAVDDLTQRIAYALVMLLLTLCNELYSQNHRKKHTELVGKTEYRDIGRA